MLLGLFGAAILLINQSRLRSGIDDELLHQATDASRRGPPHPRPPRAFPPRAQPPQGRLGSLGEDPLGGPERRGPQGANGGVDGGPGGGPDSGPGGGPDGPPGGPPVDFYAAAGQLADVRRPRFFDIHQQTQTSLDGYPTFDAVALTHALAGNATYSTVRYRGATIRVYSRPIVQGGQVMGAVQFARELTDLDLLWSAQLRTLAIVLPLAVVAAAAAAYFLTGRTLRPVGQMTRSAAAITSSQDLSRRLEVAGDDEMADLATTFNDMLARLQRSFSDLRGAYANLERAYDQQQRFTADASHELRTPLTRLRLATSAALRPDVSKEEMHDALATADRAANAMSRLVQQLLTLARVDAGELGLQTEPVDLRVVVAEGLEQANLAREVETAFAQEQLIVNVDPEQVRRVIINFVENAARHTPADRRIRVEALRHGEQAVICVKDAGEGIAAEHLPHLFERFYRADSARARKDGGSGLGLAICKNLIEAHGGRVEIESQLGIGTTVRAFFPLFSVRARAQMNSS